MAGKAKDMASLLRLNRWQVDERRRELGVLMAREESLMLFGEELYRQLLREQQAAAAEPTTAGFIYAAFGANYRKRREQLEHTLDQLRDEIEAARERLGEAYRQLKVYEQVEKQREIDEAIEAARKEQIAFDEIAQTQHRMKRG